MSPAAPAAAPRSATPSEYQPRDPTAGPLHQLLHQSLDSYLAARHARPPPPFVAKALRSYLSCGVLWHGFARFRCDDCAQSRLVALSCKQRAFCPRCVGRRMADQAKHLVERVLPPVRTRQWVLTFPHELRWHMAFDHDLTLAVWGIARRAIDAFYKARARSQGFDLDAHITVRAGARAELERMVRYILRPPLKEKRLTLHADSVVLELKTPWRDGTTHIRMSRERFIDRLVALVPPPAANTLLYGGILGANARLRRQAIRYERPGVTVTKRPTKSPSSTAPQRARNTAWAELMRHSFGLDVLACPHCGGRMRHVATILSATSIRAILRHQGHAPPEPRAGPSPPAPGDTVYEADEATQADLFDDHFSQETHDPAW